MSFIFNPNQAPPQRQVRPANPNQATQGPRQVRPMSNTTATKPTGAQAVGQVYRPNAKPANLPPRQGQVRPMGGGLMEQQNTLSKRGRMPPSKGQQSQGDPQMDKRLQQSQAATQGPLPANAQNRQGMEKALQQKQAQWDNLPPSERAKYEAAGNRRPSAGMLQGLMQTQTGNANDVAPQMMAQNQSNPTAGATGAAGPSAAGASPTNKPVVIAPPAPPAPTPTMGFDADTMTVEGRLQGLMASDNPLMQQARLQAQQQAASRGLQNSSMAVQSGQQAAYASMMPIASQDANTVYDSEKTEYGTRADSALMNQDYLNSRGLAEQGFGYDTSLMNQDIEGKRSLQLDRFGQETSLQEGDFAGRTSLQDDQQAANTARDAAKFQSDTTLQTADFAGRTGLQDDQQAAAAAAAAAKFQSDTSLQEQGIAGQQTLQTDAQKAAAAAAAAKFQSDTALQEQGLLGQQNLQTDAQAAQTARDAAKFQSDTSLQEQSIAGQLDLQGNQIRSNEQIAADRNATSIQTTQIGASAQLQAAQINASAQAAVASANNAAAAARQKTQLQGQAMINAQTQSYQQSNMDKDFIQNQQLQTERINAETDRYQATLDSQHQLSYAGGITNLQLGVQQEHSAIAQNPEMNSTQKAEAHAAVGTRFKEQSALQASIYGFEADDE